ncbi:UNVERIFIED_CONTAM: hypothetical protein Sradi_1686300 [Sesamum radiatum]|uniref:F-box domain-containing protein n=1 Tax=Sesamum radiatum TaxID=300843 RepID=A0AAW2UC23_SESRA
MEFSTSRIHLSPEVLSEVLSRLPVKSLLRFKCVSKFWVELINTPYFISLHLHNYSKQRARVNIIQLLIQSGYDIDHCFQTLHLHPDNEEKGEATNLTYPIPLEYYRPFLVSQDYKFVGMYRLKDPFCSGSCVL